MSEEPEIKKRGRGRPRKSEIAAHTPGKRKKRGRPKGEVAIMNDYKARLLASPKSEAVLHTILDVATDPEHKHWPSATKLIVERLMPQSMFEDKLGGKSREISINLNFADPSAAKVRKAEDDAVDVDFVVMDGEEYDPD